MDVYTTSFNVYPFAVPPPATPTPSSTYPSHHHLPTSSFNQQVSLPAGFSNPVIGIGGSGDFVSTNAQHVQQNGMPLQQQSQSHAAPHSQPHPNSANSAVHRHHTTHSGIELVWEHLHRLTLQAMAQYPGTVISFSRTAPYANNGSGGGIPSGSGSSSNSSEDSLALLGLSANGSSPMLSSISSPSLSIPPPGAPNVNTPPGAGGLHASISNPALSQVASSSPTPTLVSQASPAHGVTGAVAGAGVISANANASLHNGPHTRGTAFFNFTITGSSQAGVVGARGYILREAPVQNRSVIRVARSEILEPPSGAAATRGTGNQAGNGGGTSSVPMPGTGSAGALKQPVIQRLDEIAAQTRANISVLKTSSSSSATSAYPAYPHSNSNLNPYTPAPWSSSSFAGSGAGYGGMSGGSFGGANAAAQAAGLEGEKTCELIITGPGDTVDVARLRLLVMLDELSGLHAEQVDIDYKLHGILAGRRRRAVQQIQEETATNIYFPPLPLRTSTTAPSASAATTPGTGANPTPGGSNGSPNNGSGTPADGSRQGSASPTLPSVNSNGNGSENTVAAPLGYNPNIIWITGEFFNVGRARDALYQLAAHKVRSKTIISRDMAILSRKLDWMLTHRLDDVKAIQRENGTYITFPSIGSGQTTCTIYGDSRVAIERTVRAVMLLASQFYLACIWLLPLHYNVLVPSANGVNPAAMGGVLRAVCSRSGAEVICKSGMFEMHGLESEVRAAVATVLELDIIKAFQTEIRFQLELANEHREFISGKKNGKLNRIMTNTSVKIKFESLNDHNFLIDVSGSSAHNVLRGLTLLQDELPAELAFHVPEAYHKRIIGVAGRSIQRIMKKYSVYVKFNSAEELRQLALDDEENVLARTPAKNALNLELLRASIVELVPAKDKDFIVDMIPVPRRYHRALFGEKAIFLRDIENKTNCKITFPGDGLDIVMIFGPESQVHQAGAMLLDHVPYEADLTIPAHPDLSRLCASQEFLAFTEQIQRDLQVSIVPPTENGSGYPFSFKFRCQRSNCDCLSPAREHFDAFLGSHGVLHAFPKRKSSGPATPGVVGQAPSSAAAAMPQPNQFAPGSGHVFGNGHIHRRVDSFTDAFSHFNSRLLPTPLESDGLDRRIRMASSTPDVKALFHSPSHRYGVPEQRVPEQDEFDDASFYSRSSIGSGGAGNNNGIHEYAASLSEYNTVNDYSLNDHWINASTPMNAHAAGFHGLTPPRPIALEDAYKRGSDSALEAKLREKLTASQRQQHNLAARAQSLDLTTLGMTSRGLGPGGLGESTIDEGGAEGDGQESPYENSPPVSAMMPTFPSLSDAPLGNLMGSTKPRQRNLVGAGNDGVGIDAWPGRPVLDTDAVTTHDMHSMFASMNLDSPIR